jgi:hypothetical protein
VGGEGRAGVLLLSAVSNLELVPDISEQIAAIKYQMDMGLLSMPMSMAVGASCPVLLPPFLLFALAGSGSGIRYCWLLAIAWCISILQVLVPGRRAARRRRRSQKSEVEFIVHSQSLVALRCVLN